jgi:predicted Fe-S protein YdhL (DUF1289 family)
MKVCSKCGAEFDGLDGQNTCDGCKKKSKERAKMQRKARESILRDLGLVKVRGAMGGVYWE